MYLIYLKINIIRSKVNAYKMNKIAVSENCKITAWHKLYTVTIAYRKYHRKHIQIHNKKNFSIGTSKIDILYIILQKIQSKNIIIDMVWEIL